MKYVASCSCGKDSLAMVLTLIEKEYPLDHVVFFDTGKEFDSIYMLWDKLTSILDEHGIKHTKLQTVKSYDYYFSEHEVTSKDGSTHKGYSWCGGRCRWYTKMKTRTIDKFYKDTFNNEPIVEYVGIASDELDRVKMTRSNNVKVYPLILWNMSENDCLVKCYKNGFRWIEKNGVELYDVLDRVSCWCCGNKNLKELKAIYQHLPEYWQKLKDMQDKTEIPFRAGESIHDLENRFR